MAKPPLIGSHAAFFFLGGALTGGESLGPALPGFGAELEARDLTPSFLSLSAVSSEDDGNPPFVGDSEVGLTGCDECGEVALDAVAEMVGDFASASLPVFWNFLDSSNVFMVFGA